MVKNIVEQNKAITSVTREIAGLKEYFPQCFDNEGCFDIDKLSHITSSGRIATFYSGDTVFKLYINASD